MENQMSETLSAIRQKLSVITCVSEEQIRVELFRISERFGEGDGLDDWVVRTTFQEFVFMHPKAYSHPADWWQAFKGRFFPRFMLRLWPVKNTDIDVLALVENGGGFNVFFRQDQHGNID